MGTRSTPARLGVSALVVAALGVVSFGLGREVPILDWFDLAVHEAGHLLAFPLPELAMFLAGSVAQVAVPLGLGWYFWRSQRDRAALAICLAWAGTSARDVAIYIADARAQLLPLIGGGRHDWAYILGRFDALDRAESVAGLVAAIGLVMVGVGLIVVLAGFVRLRVVRRPSRSSARPIRSTPRAVATMQEYHHGDPWHDG